jgi:hypothetical protein
MDLSFLSDIETFRSNERDNAMLRKCLEDINSKYAISGFDKVQMDLFSSALLKSQKEGMYKCYDRNNCIIEK